jgi:2-polyprenyl-3-methyl-5-hydroxy-6-metoxy-1,4-benzoquinol methylase
LYKIATMNLTSDFLRDIEEGERKLSGRELVHFKSRVGKAAHILAELADAGINPAKQYKILFAGSGVGFIPYILARHTSWNIFAGDLNEEYLNRFHFIRQRINLSRLDVTEMPFQDNTFDAVIFNHVVEHVLCWEELASEGHRIVKNQGLLYLATPNLHGLYRPDLPLKVFFQNVLFRKNKNVARETRVLLHMGLSWHEIETLLAEFGELNVLNRAHVLINCPTPLRFPFYLIPAVIYRSFAPNHVVLAYK